jgi:hypothetical protein
MKGSKFGFGQFFLLFTTTVFWDFYVRSNKHARNRRAVLRMLKTMAVLMWCWHCRDSYAQFHTATPIAAQERFMPWLHNLKALVNRKLGKLNLPPEYCDALYTQAELPYWKHRQLSPQWIVALLTNLYLTALAFPASSDADRLHSFLEASEELLECIPECIPSVGSKFKGAFASALARAQAHRTVGVAAASAPASASTQHPVKIRFKDRSDMFHFIYNLECNTWASLRTQHGTGGRQDQATGSSIFGKSCADVHAYFEEVYRAEGHH